MQPSSKSPEDEERVKTGAQRAVAQAYERARLSPTDLEVIDVHDATAPAELIYYETLGLCGPGEGGRQIAEWVWQLRGQADPRQVAGHSGHGPKLALAQNSGGFIEGDSAVTTVHVLKR